MIRLVLFLLAVAAAAAGLSWLADRPGTLVLNWQGWEVETSVFRAVVIFALALGLAILAWSILRQIWQSPAAFGNLLDRRRQSRGLEALSTGMIAIGAGDRATATRYAVQARKALPNEPLTHLLRAQAAQLSGDRATSRRIFEAMLAAPDTEQLGLRGLFLEAEKEGETEAARQFAERALSLNPKLAWPVDALFDLQCRKQDWAGALATLGLGRKYGHIDKRIADRRRAVLLTALAQKVDDQDPNKAQALALEAHHLAVDLVPAAEIAARHLASRGNTGKAAKVIQATWKRAPHPDLAAAYAFARPGDSPRDRLERVRGLTRLGNSPEGPIALAAAAVEARAFDEARRALEPLLAEGATQRVCTLMARIEAADAGDKGRVREWLARAVNAARDPAWTADGFVSDRWLPASPVTNALDAFQWKVPGERLEKEDAGLIAAKAETLVALGAADETATRTIEVPAATRPATVGTMTVRDAATAAVSVAAAARSLPTTVEILPPTAAAAAPAETGGTSLGLPPARPAAAVVETPSPAPATPVDKPIGLVKTGAVVAAAPPTRTTANGATAAPKGGATPAAIVAASTQPTPPKVAAGEQPIASAARRTGDGVNTGRGTEPRFYAPPRAPDDPGPDGTAAEETGTPSPVPRIRATPAKN